MIKIKIYIVKLILEIASLQVFFHISGLLLLVPFFEQTVILIFTIHEFIQIQIVDIEVILIKTHICSSTIILFVDVWF